MPNEIYHRSEWGNPKAEGFGDVYFDPAATNKLYNHSDNYENSDGTDKILRDIPNKASIVLTPTAYSDGSLNTVIPTDGNGDFDFSRGSSATRVNEKGLIEDVASGIPRIDYTSGQGALLLEPQRTNLITYSEDFSQSYWTKSRASVTNNSLISPNGTLNASKFTQTTSTAWGGVVLTITPSGASTLSIFAKKIDNDYIALIGHNSNDTKVYFNLDNGTIGTVGVDVTNADIQNYGNGWYRCILTASSINRFTVLHSTTDNGNTANLNTETSLWGAQVEQAGSYATSIIKTEGSTVTRSADVANNSGNADLFNDSEGVLYAEVAALADDQTFRMISVSDGTNNNRVRLNYTSTSNQIQARVVDGGTTVADLNETLADITIFAKAAIKYKANDCALWINGFEVAADTSATMPTGLDTLNFDGGDGGLDFYGKTKELAVFKEALTDAELESLTSWVSFTEMATDLEYTLE